MFAKAIVASTVPIVTKVKKISLSMMRRAQPTMFASKLIKVHPMAGPTGQVFYMNLVNTEPKKKNFLRV